MLYPFRKRSGLNNSIKIKLKKKQTQNLVTSFNSSKNYSSNDKSGPTIQCTPQKENNLYCLFITTLKTYPIFCDAYF